MKRWMVAVMVAALGATAAWADDDMVDPPRTRTEVYVGLLAARHDIGGDFDNRAYGNAEGAALAPEIDPAFGGGLVFGLRGIFPSERAIALEGSIQGSRHDGDFGTDVNFGLFSLDAKFFPVTGRAVEPWIQAGLNWASVEVENGWMYNNGQQKDADYQGSGFDVGVGLLTYLSPRFAVHVAGIYRFLTYDALDYGPRVDIKNDLEANTFSLELGATVRFGRRN